MEYKIREIDEKDNKEIENIIRSCLIEFGVNHEGTAWAVNGPGEAREADIGIAGGVKEGLIFKKGEIIKKVPQEDIVEVLKQEILKIV